MTSNALVLPEIWNEYYRNRRCHDSDRLVARAQLLRDNTLLVSHDSIVTNHEFWEDQLVYCDTCGGCKCHTCTCPGGPCGPEFHPGFDDGFPTETTSKVTEVINSMDYNTGWQYVVTGSNVEHSGSSITPPSQSATSNTINGGLSAWTGLDHSNRPNWTIKIRGQRSSLQKRTPDLV